MTDETAKKAVHMMHDPLDKARSTADQQKKQNQATFEQLAE